MKRILYLVIVTGVMCSPLLSQKELPPDGGVPKDFVLPAKETVTLDNGLRATLVPYGSVPKVWVSAAVRTGAIDESADDVWLSDMTCALMKEGTTTRDATAIAREAARMGGSLDVAPGLYQTTIGGTVLAEFGERYMALLADVVRNPSFPASELPRLKGDKLRDLSIARSQPQTLAQERFLKVMYPDHPRGRTFPTEAMLKGFSVEQIKAFHENNFGARRTHLYIVGQFDSRSMVKALREAFGDWKKGPEPTLVPPVPAGKREIRIVDRPGASQSTIYMGVSVIDPSNEEYTALAVTDALLGGAFGSRITANIRENKGYTYSPGSFLMDSYRSSCWIEAADVTTDVTGASLKEIFSEIDRLQADPPPIDELKGIQTYLAGIFVLMNSEPSAIVTQLQFIDVYRLPDTYLTEYVKRVHAVTPETVRRLAREQIRDDKMLIVIVGDRAKIEDQVRPYGRIVE